MHQWADAWNSHDIDTLVEIKGDACGFGFRTRGARDRGKVSKERYRAFLSNWFSKMESYEFIPEQANYRVIGDTGISRGFFREKLKPKGGEHKEIKGRYTSTYVKLDGKWKHVLFHRDIQRFGEN